nr:MAG TPA: hypothetical protein [Caudoviricetes sp.]
MFILDSRPGYRPARRLKQRLSWWAIPLRFRHKKNTP